MLEVTYQGIRRPPTVCIAYVWLRCVPMLLCITACGRNLSQLDFAFRASPASPCSKAFNNVGHLSRSKSIINAASARYPRSADWTGRVATTGCHLNSARGPAGGLHAAMNPREEDLSAYTESLSEG